MERYEFVTIRRSLMFALGADSYEGARSETLSPTSDGEDPNFEVEKVSVLCGKDDDDDEKFLNENVEFFPRRYMTMIRRKQTSL